MLVTSLNVTFCHDRRSARLWKINKIERVEHNGQQISLKVVVWLWLAIVLRCILRRLSMIRLGRLGQWKIWFRLCRAWPSPWWPWYLDCNTQIGIKPCMANPQLPNTMIVNKNFCVSLLTRARLGSAWESFCFSSGPLSESLRTNIHRPSSVRCYQEASTQVVGIWRVAYRPIWRLVSDHYSNSRFQGTHTQLNTPTPLLKVGPDPLAVNRTTPAPTRELLLYK